MSRRKILRTITDQVGLHSEAVSGVTLLEISGDDRVLIENFICILGYTDSTVQVQVEFGIYEISGGSLVISCIQKDQMVIYGRVDCITLRRE